MREIILLKNDKINWKANYGEFFTADPSLISIYPYDGQEKSHHYPTLV